jgi:hypothetical protein
MKANTAGNFILFLLSAGCLVMTALLLYPDGHWGTVSPTKSSNSKVPDQEANLSELAARLLAIEKSLEGITGTISGSQTTTQELQSAIHGLREELERIAVAKVSPAMKMANPGENHVLPDGLREFLAGAEKPGSFDKWDETKAQIKRRELVSIVNSLDGRQRDAIREEITRANWILEVLEQRNQTALDSPEQWIARYVTAQTLAESIPDSITPELKESTSACLKSASVALIGYVVGIHDQLRSGKQVTEIELRTAVSVVELMDKEASQDLLKMSEAFVLFLSMEDWLRDVGELKPPFRRDLGPSDELLTRRMLSLIQQGQRIRDQISSLGLGVPKRINEPLEELGTAVNVSATSYQRGQSAAYQIWALENIKLAEKYQSEVPSEVIGTILSLSKDNPGKAAKEAWIPALINNHPSFRKKLGSLTGINSYLEPGDVNVDWKLLQKTAQALDQLTSWKGQDELAKCLTRDLIEVRLMVIDETLLERPVANLYNETFEKCWKDLEGTGHRVALAEASAKVRKLQPEDIGKP